MRWVWLGVLALGACAGGARDPAEQIVAGAEVYRARCVRCHEREGGIGPALSPQVLFAYGTPQRLVDYVTLAMPYDSAGTLHEEEYWDVVAYLLDGAGLRAGTAVLDETEGAVALRRPSR